ncbi:Disease resistance protein RUN1 [Linum perenne]
MASSSSSSASTSSSPLLTYDVFLSFRGSDTRHGFISHLYNALRLKGISTFKDDLKLERGKLISPEILRAIQRSRFSIVVFSKDYASSPWCLEELETIIQCMEEKEIHAVLPIFYGVDPSDVSEVKNSYAESFAKHEMDSELDPGMLQSWKAALNKAAELSGWDSRYRDEPTLINEIVKDVLSKLGREYTNKPLGLVGMKPRIKEVELLLRTGLVDVRVVGIWGMAGIGKTTTAEAVYHSISHKFDACCFLKNVREAAEIHGLDYLRNKLLSQLIVEDGLRILDEQLDLLMKGRLRSKCILVVLDDVSDVDQLTSLAGDREWFGSGSRIMVTTTNKHLLELHEVDAVYEVKPLSDIESFHLFRQNAFKKTSSVQELVALSDRVVNYAKGLPLALKVLGSSLCNMNRSEWESRMNTLEETPPGNIVKMLRLSFDVLEDSEKSIFLDIACFFNGEDKEYVMSIVEGAGFSPAYSLKVLLNRSLISIQDDRVWMHDLLRQMGLEIVRQESNKEAGKRSRLWNSEDICNVLAQRTGTKDVEGIVLDISKVKDASFGLEAFREMSRLRFLEICYIHQSGSSEYLVGQEASYPDETDNSPQGSRLHLRQKLRTLSNELKSLHRHGYPFNIHKRLYGSAESSKLRFSGKLTTLSNELRILHWHEYPLDYLPSDFYPRNLVELNLSYSRIQKFWTGKKVFEKLKFMKLSHSQELIQTPDYSGIPNLEILILEGCLKLTEVHPSVISLEKLICLNLKGCKSLCRLPKSIGMKSLQVLILSGCSKIKKLPEFDQNMVSLSELLLDGTDIPQLPASVQNLTSLLVLSVTNCKRLEFIPEAVGRCRSLKILRLTGCSNLRLLNIELDSLENLEEMHAEGTRLRLNYLMVDRGPKNLKVLSLSGSDRLPWSVRDVCRDILYRTETDERQRLMRMLFYGRDRFNLTDVSSSLTSLDLSNCNLDDLSYGIIYLEGLRKLDLSGNPITYLSIIPENLQVLRIANCNKLLSLHSLPSTAYCLDAPNCTSLPSVHPPAGLESGRMRGFNFMNCIRLGNVAVELLKIHVEKTPPHSVAEMTIIIPATRIPAEWLPHQTNSNKASIILAQDWYNNNLKGLALWTTFKVLDSRCRAEVSLDFELKCNDQNVISEVGFGFNAGTAVNSDHLWLRYIPVFMFKTIRSRDSSSCVEVVFVSNSPELVVKRCGLYPVCRDKYGQWMISPSSTVNSGPSRQID